METNEQLTQEEIAIAEEIGLEPVRKAVIPGVKEDPNKVKPAAPAVIHGEFVDRPYLVTRVVRALYDNTWENAKIEKRVHELLQDKLGYASREGGRFIPLNVKFLENAVPQLRSLGLNEMMRIQKRAQGEDNLSSGGFLIDSETSDDIIELMRARAVVEAAGAQVLNMPPGGQLDIPKLVEGSTTYHVGEFEQIGEGALKFGMLGLRAKYLGVLVPASNRALRHSEGLLEGFIRREIAEALQLAKDYDCLLGAGGTNIPLGIVNWPDVQDNDINAAITAEDILDIEEMALSENATGPFTFIGNTKVRNKIRQLRSGTLRSDNTPDYTTGQFVFIRDLVEGETRDTLLGHQFLVSTQIPTDSNNKTTLIFGQFNKAIIAQEPVLEIAVSEHVGFKSDMTYFKAILGFDFGITNEKAFVVSRRIVV